jgi:hypothetical protein
MRWSLSMQRELPGSGCRGRYVASRSYDLTTDVNLNPSAAVSVDRRTCATTRSINFLTANVANPFAGLLPGETLNNATVAAPAAAAAVSRSSQHRRAPL